MLGLVAGSAISEVPVLGFGEDHGAVSVPQTPRWHSEAGEASDLSAILQSPKQRWRGFDRNIHTELTLHSFARSRV